MGRKDWIGGQQARLDRTYGTPVNLNAGTGGPSDLVREGTRGQVKQLISGENDGGNPEKPKFYTITFYTGDE